jgi:hypothetical protein
MKPDCRFLFYSSSLIIALLASALGLASCGENGDQEESTADREAQQLSCADSDETPKPVLKSDGTFSGFHCCGAGFCASNDGHGVSCGMRYFAENWCINGNWIGPPTSSTSVCPFSDETPKPLLQPDGTFSGFHCCEAVWCAKNDSKVLGNTCTLATTAGKTCSNGQWISPSTNSPTSACPESGETPKQMLQPDGTFSGFYCCRRNECAQNDPTYFGEGCTIGAFAGRECINGYWSSRSRSATSGCAGSFDVKKPVLQPNGKYSGYLCCWEDFCAYNHPVFGTYCTTGGSFAGKTCRDGHWW